MQVKIAITGPVASGKSFVLRIFREKGFRKISADKNAHQLLKEKKTYKKILKHFGKEILTKGGSISRKKLGDIVFKIQKEKKVLEKILHPDMKKKILDFLKKYKRVAVENALLFEMNMEKNFDKIICVVPARNKENLLIRKKGLSREKFIQIKKMQLSSSLKMKKSDFVIKNTGRKKDIKRKVEEILKKIEKS